MKLTLVFPFYKNPTMMARQVEMWRTYLPSVRDNLEIIVVDDGSPVGVRAEEVPGVKDFASIYRILVDLPWNMCGARNLGVFHASHPWVLWCDIDHLITNEFLEGLFAKTVHTGWLYRFERIKHVDRQPNTSHMEIRMCHTDLFWRLGGFDESFCGHYAFSEREFFHRKCVVETETSMMPLALERVSSDEIADCKTYGFVRKEGRDDEAYNRIEQWKHENKIGIERFKLPWVKIA